MTGFNGDGHISMFRFDNGSVDYTGRYVMTDRLKAERAARRRLFGVYRNRLTDDPSVRNVNRGAANTHMYWHGGKFMALKEDSLPYLLDPHTLDTLGTWDFHGKYKAVSMSAHPKVDPVNGQMIAYGYQAKGDLTDDIAIYTMDPKGNVIHEIWIKAPYVGMVHDIAMAHQDVARRRSEPHLLLRYENAVDDKAWALDQIATAFEFEIDPPMAAKIKARSDEERVYHSSVPMELSSADENLRQELEAAVSNAGRDMLKRLGYGAP